MFFHAYMSDNPEQLAALPHTNLPTWNSMTFQDLGQNSMTFQAWNPNYQIPWLSRFSRTGTNPALKEDGRSMRKRNWPWLSVTWCRGTVRRSGCGRRGRRWGRNEAGRWTGSWPCRWPSERSCVRPAPSLSAVPLARPTGCFLSKRHINGDNRGHINAAHTCQVYPSSS